MNTGTLNKQSLPISFTLHCNEEHEVFMNEEDFKSAWEFCGNDFKRFVELLRFIARFGERPE